MLSTFKLESNLLQHGGQVPTLNTVETAKQFSAVDPLGSIVGKLDLREYTLWEQALLDIPRTETVRVKIAKLL